MAIEFYSSIDLNLNELQHLRLQQSGSNPTSPTPVSGQVYYNSGDNTVRFYDGSNWQTLSTTTGDITGVTAGDGLTGGGNSGAVTLNVVGGDGITANANDIAITAAQTTITSIKNTSLAIGRDDDNLIKFSTDNQIIFEVSGGDNVIFKASGEIEASSLDISGDVDIDGTLETDALSINGTSVSSTAAELNILDGVTASTSELNIMDGVTATTSELNIMDGVTSTTAELNILDGVTATASELNIMDGVTSTTAELNVLDGITAVVGELNALDLGSTAVGTAIASKAVILDSNKDYTGIRNFTITGELDAASLDISGNADIDGTLETDALTVGGTNILSGGIITSLGTIAQDTVTFQSANSEDPLVIIENKVNDEGGARLRFVKDKGAAGADNDIVGLIEFNGDNDAQQQTTFARMLAQVNDASDGAEEGKLILSVASHDGELQPGITITSGDAEDEVDVTIGNGSNSVVTIPGNLTVTGTQTVNNVVTVSTSNGVQFEGTAADGNDAILKSAVASSDKTYTLPNITGHIPILSNDPGTTAVSATVAELNIMDGVTASTSEINIMDGVTATTSELNIMDGVTATTSELNVMDGITATTSELNILDGVTSTASELNILDGVTATASELNVMDGITATTGELNLVDGGTSRGTTAVANGDGFLHNDNGTMRMTNVSKLADLFAGTNITASSSVLSVADAADDTKGVVELATAAEVITGTDAARVVTADTLSAKSVVCDIDVSSLTDQNIVTITHNLGTADIIVQVYDKTTEANIMCDIARTTDDFSTASTSVVSIDFGTAPPNDCRALITSLAGATAGSIAYT